MAAGTSCRRGRPEAAVSRAAHSRVLNSATGCARLPAAYRTAAELRRTTIGGGPGTSAPRLQRQSSRPRTGSPPQCGLPSCTRDSSGQAALATGPRHGPEPSCASSRAAVSLGRLHGTAGQRSRARRATGAVPDVARGSVFQVDLAQITRRLAWIPCPVLGSSPCRHRSKKFAAAGHAGLFIGSPAPDFTTA